MLLQFAAFSGVLAAFWIVLGVVIAGARYPGYSHLRQLCSELGAVGSPTEKFSPLINNYPLGILFCVFGGYVLYVSNSLLFTTTGWLVIVHGMATFVAGYFPMDADPYTQTPSKKCEVHTLAGVVMLLSLLIANVLVIFANVSSGLRVFSAVCLVLVVVFLILMAQAFKQRGNVGLYQRLSYGAQLLWLAGVSVTHWQALI
ncbi:DUF998 domain-containing protein [Saccharophagus degradans]|uniref:DUF998 domain-containing protein n=1 Tax=Saccharophagus degradans TaxID=86304 RepID=A0AAW7X403_9GAMM|nr:DUF998 domain-containing protein [Saccharophagus degradans]MDO6421366.1 DUF998 domain-containing protein [Saccharophagus degradans]MDO6609563.1 DUF998 domain-containing protein [Saccharophagus degradans]